MNAADIATCAECGKPVVQVILSEDTYWYHVDPKTGLWADIACASKGE